MVSRIHKIHRFTRRLLRCWSAAATRIASSTRPSHKRPSFWVRSPGSAGSVLYRFRQDGAMGLFLVLFWCSAIAGDALRYNSRFGGFNSRLSRRKFAFRPLREFAGKSLIYLTVLAAKDDGYRR